MIDLGVVGRKRSEGEEARVERRWRCEVYG